MNFVAAIMVGALVGIIYFSGLWLTVRQIVIRQSAAGLAMLSWLGRMLLLGLVFYVLSRRSAEMALVGLGGFWCTRFYLLHRLGGGSHAG